MACLIVPRPRCSGAVACIPVWVLGHAKSGIGYTRTTSIKVSPRRSLRRSRKSPFSSTEWLALSSTVTPTMCGAPQCRVNLASATRRRYDTGPAPPMGSRVTPWCGHCWPTSIMPVQPRQPRLRRSMSWDARCCEETRLVPSPIPGQAAYRLTHCRVRHTLPATHRGIPRSAFATGEACSMAQHDIALMAHLLRRAGFGATREALERYVAKGYEATVEELLHPEDGPPALEDEDLIRRYHVDENSLMLIDSCQTYWLYNMVNTRRPLEEKIALFWHGVFATGYTKLNQPKQILRQIAMFRRCGLGNFHTLLTEVSKDPAMIFWLDNKDSHKEAVNENYGRELLELFSMGVGNYSEHDVRQCSRAFTGWTIHNASLHTARVARDSVWPYGRLDWQFEYREDDHDAAEKTFLGQVGAFNGEEIIDIICRQPATARFIARHLYNFFVADEPQVPAWQTVPPNDPEAIQILVDAIVTHDYDIRAVMRILFNADFFKRARFAKVKSPTELVVGTVRLAGGHRFPDVDDITLALE